MALTGPPGVELAQLQGNILRSYGRSYCHVRHLVLAVARPARARDALAAMVDGDPSTPEMTRADVAPKDADRACCLNVGITYRGLEALGVPAGSLATFPRELRDGMVARAGRLGDVGQSSPEQWLPGLADGDRVHLLVTIHTRRAEDLGPASEQVLGAGRGRAFELVTEEPLDGAFLTDAQGNNIVHFGFNDGISQPRFEHVHPDDGPGALSPIGLVLLGHRVPGLGLSWSVPQPEVLGYNGTFAAFRVLRQDVAGFEAFVGSTAAATGCSTEEVAAKLCGRWRNGAPLALAPTEAAAAAFGSQDLNKFGYLPDDADGSRCPLGSHIRRTNPRDSHLVQRGTSPHRALVRRGVPYGPPYDPGAPGDEDVPRGLLGNFLCASLAAQFEGMQADWLNVGLQDPRLTGTNDPLVGANDGRTSEFRWTTSRGEPVVTRGVPGFVRTEGGCYCFVPSIPALRWIASRGWRGA